MFEIFIFLGTFSILLLDILESKTEKYIIANYGIAALVLICLFNSLTITLFIAMNLFFLLTTVDG